MKTSDTHLRHAASLLSLLAIHCQVIGATVTWQAATNFTNEGQIQTQSFLSLSSFVKPTLVASLIAGTGWSLVQGSTWNNKEPSVESAADGSVTLTSAEANIMGPGGARLNDYAGKSDIGWWDSAEQSLEWKVDVSQAGAYRVELEYALPNKWVTDFDLICGKQTLSITTTGTSGFDKESKMTAGELKLNKGSDRTFTLKVTKLPRKDGL